MSAMRRRKRVKLPGREEPEAAPIPGGSNSGSSGPATKKRAAGSEAEPETAPIPVAATRKMPPDVKPRPGGIVQQWGKIPRGLIEGYRLEKLMGEGSMGAVFKAEQLSLHRPVAIKVLSPRLAHNERFLKRFLREARAVAKLNHANVVSGIDVGQAGEFHYFVMEFVEGPTLLDMLQDTLPVDPMTSAKLILQVARALEHADRHGLIHRDVKPANVIITLKGGVAKLCDLGLAKHVDEDGGDTSEGRAMGTPLYISPEQARGQADIDIRSDLYSLGATFYHALTGRPPFAGPTHAVIMAKHLTEPLVPVRDRRADVPPGCAAVCECLLSKDRDDRYGSPTELIVELQDVIDGNWEPEPLIKTRRRSRRRRFR